MTLNDNTVLITGGTSGIGLALATALQAQGNCVIVCGRNEAKLKALKQQNPSIITARCDLNDEGDIEQLTQNVIAEHPQLNILINNAGVQHNYLFDGCKKHQHSIKDEVTVNLLAPMLLTNLLLPQLLKQKTSAIINVTSALALAPKSSAPVYCATKAALRSFTQALRYQLEDSPVAVVELIPSLVDTKMTSVRGSGKISPDELAKEALASISAGRQEIRIEKTKWLFLMHRIAPAFTSMLLKNS